MTRTRITVTIHDRQDPACVKHDGIRAPWGLRWLFRCDTCRRDRADAEERSE